MSVTPFRLIVNGGGSKTIYWFGGIFFQIPPNLAEFWNLLLATLLGGRRTAIADRS